MKKGTRKWWLLAIPVLLAAVALAVVHWDAVVIHVAPKAVLTPALSKAFSQLEDRFQDDPLLILAKALDREGKYTADVVLETEKELLGPVTYDMSVQTDAKSRRLSTTGSIHTASQALDLSLYLDSAFMAVSSEALAGGTYYGITYDTFPSDLGKIPLMNYVASDELLSQWESSIQAIQSRMNRTWPLPQVPELTHRDVRKLLLGVAALPCRVVQEEVVVNGVKMPCDRLNYKISGSQVSRALSAITGKPHPEDTAVTVSFYLYEDTVVKIVLTSTADEAKRCYDLTLGTDPGHETLLLQGTQAPNGEFFVAITTKKGDTFYEESWECRKKADGISTEQTYTFRRDSRSGAVLLKTNSAPEGVHFVLNPSENGFRLETDDGIQLMHALMNQPKAEGWEAVRCSMSVQRGSQVTPPNYKNLDQWSMEDFLLLLSSLGPLFSAQTR